LKIGEKLAFEWFFSISSLIIQEKMNLIFEYSGKILIVGCRAFENSGKI